MNGEGDESRFRNRRATKKQECARNKTHDSRRRARGRCEGDEGDDVCERGMMRANDKDNRARTDGRSFCGLAWDAEPSARRLGPPNWAALLSQSRYQGSQGWVVRRRWAVRRQAARAARWPELCVVAFVLFLVAVPSQWEAAQA